MRWYFAAGCPAEHARVRALTRELRAAERCRLEHAPPVFVIEVEVRAGRAISQPRRALVCNRWPKSRRADRAGGFFGHQTLRSLAHALYLPGRRTLQGCA
jgi:hypothetical protein